MKVTFSYVFVSYIWVGSSYTFLINLLFANKKKFNLT